MIAFFFFLIQTNITLSNLQLPTLGREEQSSEAVWQLFIFFFLGGGGGGWWR